MQIYEKLFTRGFLLGILIDGRPKFTEVSIYETEKTVFMKISRIRKFVVVHEDHFDRERGDHSCLAGLPDPRHAQ